MTPRGSKNGDELAGKTDPPKKGLGLSPIQVISGGAAAAVASVVGGRLGLAGTVVGAFFISVVSGIALPLFRASLEKSHEQIKRAVPRRGTEAARTARPPTTTGTVRVTSSKVSATPLSPDQPWESTVDAGQAPRKSGMGRKAWMAIGGTVTVFVIGVGSILGIQAAIGVPLSHGTSDLQSGISQAVTSVKDSKGSPATATDPKSSVPSAEPTAPATDPSIPSAEPTAPAAVPAEQQPATPAPTSAPAPSAEPTTPTDADTPAPANIPNPAAGTSDSGNGAPAPASGSQAQPDTGTSGGDAPAQ